MLSDTQWERIAPELSDKAGDPGSSGRNNRLFVEEAEEWKQLRQSDPFKERIVNRSIDLVVRFNQFERI